MAKSSEKHTEVLFEPLLAWLFFYQTVFLKEWYNWLSLLVFVNV